MASLWERIRALKGWTLPTVSGRAAFDITSVDDGYVQVVPHSSRKPRAIKREEFERAEILGLATADVTPIQLRRAGVSEFNPAYGGDHPCRGGADHAGMITHGARLLLLLP